MPPFVIFSLPRSRSAWLAHWLGAVCGQPVAHDMAIECDTTDEWLEALYRRVRGSCETGAAAAWPVLRQALPHCRIVLVWRDIIEVAASAERAGLPVSYDELERRYEAMLEMSGLPNVLSVQFSSLASPRTCAAIQRHCLGTEFDWPRWAEMDRVNIQVDMPARIQRLQERAAPIAALKTELADRLEHPRPFVTVGEERWSDIARQCEAMGAGHHAEATEGTEGPYRLDQATVAQMAEAGIWRVVVARVDSVMVGYCCWTLATNHEADGPPTMMQGPFYVLPEAARHRIGRRLLDVSRALFEAAGIKALRLHHTSYGRGARTGVLYRRMGAVEAQREYHLNIGA
jgi:GNAT superfamily N-acetyltransferase